MAELHCIFDTPLIVERFSCSQAIPVIRRGGTEINCAQASCHAQCQAMLEQVKPQALLALNTEDDLLVMPRSAILKIHHGTLMALNELINNIAEPIDDIAMLMDQASKTFNPAHPLPLNTVIEAISNFKTRNRSRKNS